MSPELFEEQHECSISVLPKHLFDVLGVLQTEHNNTPFQKIQLDHVRRDQIILYIHL